MTMASEVAHTLPKPNGEVASTPEAKDAPQAQTTAWNLRYLFLDIDNETDWERT
jgi:hypothetical protein